MSKGSSALLWIIGIVVVVLIIIFGVRSNGARNSTSNNSEPIKIGFIGPLTGDVAALAKASKSAVEIAVDEVNQGGGINGRPLEVTYEDGKCSPGPATSAGQKLISVDKVIGIIGGLCSGETSAIVPSAMQNKIITISYCSSAPALSNSGQYFFRTYPSDAYQGIFAADYAYNTLGARKIAIVYHVSDWGTGIKDVFSEEFKKLGGTVALTEGTAQDVRDYRTQVAKVQASGSDHVYIPVYPDGGEVLVKQLVQAGISTSKIIGAEDLNDPKFLTDTKGIAEGIVVTASKISPSDSFKQKMIAKNGGNEVPICAPEAYDAMMVLAQGLKIAGTDPDQLAEAIRSIDWTGESGEISFDTHGDLKKASYVVKKIQNGSLVETK
jgi:branched-chain amino acid transport system substrate-binding protein